MDSNKLDNIIKYFIVCFMKVNSNRISIISSNAIYIDLSKILQLLVEDASIVMLKSKFVILTYDKYACLIVFAKISNNKENDKRTINYNMKFQELIKLFFKFPTTNCTLAMFGDRYSNSKILFSQLLISYALHPRKYRPRAEWTFFHLSHTIAYGTQTKSSWPDGAKSK